MANPGLIQISKSQWKQSAAGKRGASWGDFVRSYLAHHGITSPGGGNPADPLAPLTPQQEAAAASNLVTPVVNAQTSAINNSFNQQQRLGAQAVTGYSRAFANDLNKIAPQAQAGYGNAASTIGSAYDSIQGSTTQAGKDALAALAAKEQAIGANDPSLLSSAGLYGTAAGNIGAARAATTADLMMRGAGAGATAAALPGVAALAGSRNLRIVNESTGLNRATALKNLAAQVPQMTSQALSQIQSNEVNKAVANATASYHQGLLDNANSTVPYTQAAKLSSATGDKVVLQKNPDGSYTPVDTGKPKPGKGAKGTAVTANERLTHDTKVLTGAYNVAKIAYAGNGKVDPTTAAAMRAAGLPVDDGKKTPVQAFNEVVHYFKLHGYAKADKAILWTHAFDALGAAGYDVTGIPQYTQLVKAQNAAAAQTKKK